MNDLIDWLSKLSAPRRNHFYFGKMMGVEQFETEQRYGMGQRWLGNRLTLGTGILCGLRPSLSADGKRICITRGVAVDPQGREIIVPRADSFDPFQEPTGCCDETREVPTKTGTHQICLHYRECRADPVAVPVMPDCDSMRECEAETTIESYALSLREPMSPDPFDCVDWLKPMVDPDEGTPEEPATRPPDEAELRTRLVEKLKKGQCSMPTDGCVVLGTVEIVQEADGNTLKLGSGQPSTDGQIPIYTQAQLFDLIICLAAKLAECCGGHTEPTTTLRVQSLRFFRPGATEGSLEEALPRQPPTDPPVFDAISGPRILTHVVPQTWKPLLLRLTFNLPVYGATVQHAPTDPPSTVTPTTPPSGVVLRMIDESTGQGVAVPSYAVLESEFDLLVACRGEPGLYKLTLQGSPVGTSPAVTTWDVDPAKRQALDGEPHPTFPSGDGTPRGDFFTMFRLALPPDLLRLDDVVWGTAGSETTLQLSNHEGLPEWVWSDNGRTLEVQFQFNRLVDEDSFNAEARYTYMNRALAVRGKLLAGQERIVIVKFNFEAQPVDVGLLHIELGEQLEGQLGEPFDGERGETVDQNRKPVPTGDGKAIPLGPFAMDIRIVPTPITPPT